MKEEKIKKAVRKRYAKVAKTNGSSPASSCSCCSAPPSNTDVSKAIGYSQDELNAVPEFEKLTSRKNL